MALSDRYFVTGYTLLGTRRYRVGDVLNPHDDVKDLRNDVDRDDFETEQEANELCARLNNSVSKR